MSSKIKSFFRRISKDHGGGGGGGTTKSTGFSSTESEGRKGSSSAPPSILPSKRGHKDQESSASTDDLTSSSKEKSSVGSKPQKLKKMSAPPLSRPSPITIAEKDEAMDIGASVGEPGSAAGNPTACSGGVSATITINSVIPLKSSAPPSTIPVIVDSTLKNTEEDPKAPSRRDPNDVTDCGRRQGYSLTKNTTKNQPVKSVSITKLEGNAPEVVSVQPSATSPTGTRVVSVHRKLSPTKEFLSSEFSKASTTRGQDGDAPTIPSSSSTATRKISAPLTSGNKKFKKSFADEDPVGASAIQPDEMEEESSVGLLKDKIKSLEKTVSDLVKNSEIKKQEIAALKMEIKRLKEAARDKGHNSDEENNKKSSSTFGDTSGPSLHKGAKGLTSVSTSGDRTVNDRVDELLEENRVLRSQLLHLGGSLNSSRLSDQEKEALLKGGSWGERSTTGATIGDWDNKSSSSEVSVACLQDRIMQMEETHYCTNEELQATLQELDDLREQLAESQAEVQQMQEEKQVLLESLTQQTERLSDTRAQNLTLKQLVIQHSENSHSVSNCVNTQRLMELLKSVEDDRERLAMMQEDLQAQKNAAAVAEKRSMQDSQMYRDRMKSLESLVECSSAGKAAAESQSAELQETVKAIKLENSRLETALSASKEKIGELEARLVGGGSVGEVLEVVRAEKAKLEEQVEELTKRIHSASCDNDKLKEQITSLQEKLKVAEAHARDGLHDASARSERMQEERRQLQQQVKTAESALADAKATAQRHLQTKRELKTALSDLQKKLDEALENKHATEELMQQQKEQFDKQVEEWEQFQCDLLTTVRVANDFKTDAQAQLEKMQQENALLKHKIGLLEKKVAGGKGANSPSGGGGTSASDRRNSSRPLSRGDSRVKSLIESLESGTAVPVATTAQNGRPGNRSASTSSIETNNSANVSRKISQPLMRRPDTEMVIRSTNATSPLKDSGNIEAGSNGGPVSPLRTIHRNAFSDTAPSSQPSSYSKVSPAPPSSPTANLPDTVKMSQLNSDKSSSKLIPESTPISILSNKVDVRKTNFSQLGGDKKDPLASLAQGGGSKRNALLKWCQNQTIGYSQVDITNFSSSWNDGLALCAILDTYIPDRINYRSLNYSDKRANFEKAIAAAESVGIPSTLDINDMVNSERPNWQTVYNYVTSIYAHFET